MKKLILIIAAIFILALHVTAAHADTFTDNFDSYASGTVPFLWDPGSGVKPVLVNSGFSKSPANSLVATTTNQYAAKTLLYASSTYLYFSVYVNESNTANVASWFVTDQNDNSIHQDIINYSSGVWRFKNQLTGYVYKNGLSTGWHDFYYKLECPTHSYTLYLDNALMKQDNLYNGQTCTFLSTFKIFSSTGAEVNPWAFDDFTNSSSNFSTSTPITDLSIQINQLCKKYSCDNVCLNISTSTGLLDDMRWSIECGGKKTLCWVINPDCDSITTMVNSENALQSDFPFTVYHQISDTFTLLSTTTATSSKIDLGPTFFPNYTFASGTGIVVYSQTMLNDGTNGLWSNKIYPALQMLLYLATFGLIVNDALSLARKKPE